MPKETVYGEHIHFDRPGSVVQTPQVPIVDTLWGKDTGYVQLVTKATEPNGGRYAGESPDTHVTDGYFVDLDRSAVNQLIRNLRRARDQAFGRDE